MMCMVHSERSSSLTQPSKVVHVHEFLNRAHFTIIHLPSRKNLSMTFESRRAQSYVLHARIFERGFLYDRSHRFADPRDDNIHNFWLTMAIRAEAELEFPSILFYACAYDILAKIGTLYLTTLDPEGTSAKMLQCHEQRVVEVWSSEREPIVQDRFERSPKNGPSNLLIRRGVDALAGEVRRGLGVFVGCGCGFDFMQDGEVATCRLGRKIVRLLAGVAKVAGFGFEKHRD